MVPRGIGRTLLSGIAILLATTAVPGPVAEDDRDPKGAVDRYVEDDVVRLPEPLVFDLVRGLGARRGELETNVLALFPTGSSRTSDILWAPEVEYAVVDGFALELELPFDAGELEGYKLAAQGTFGIEFGQRYIHGTQFIAEYLDAPDLWELTLLYLAGTRFDDTWSLLAMIGVRAEVGDGRGNDHEPIVNLNLFADIARRLTVGLEADYAGGLSDSSELLLMPQVHWETTEHVMIQVGFGTLLTSEASIPSASLRAIYTF